MSMEYLVSIWNLFRDFLGTLKLLGEERSSYEVFCLSKKNFSNEWWSRCIILAFEILLKKVHKWNEHTIVKSSKPFLPEKNNSLCRQPLAIFIYTQTKRLPLLVSPFWGSVGWAPSKLTKEEESLLPDDWYFITSL